MLTWWRRRTEFQKQVTRDADNLRALFGEGAYLEALGRARHEDDTGGDPSHWLGARRARVSGMTSASTRRRDLSAASRKHSLH